MTAEFIELAGKVNQHMPYHCVEKVERVLNDAAKPVRGSRIVVFGVSYKAGVGDMRESPALKIMRVLREHGRRHRLPRPARARAERARPAQRPGSTTALDGADIALIVTAHPEVDHDAIVDRAPLVLDLRGVTRRRIGERSSVLL